MKNPKIILSTLTLISMTSCGPIRGSSNKDTPGTALHQPKKNSDEVQRHSNQCVENGQCEEDRSQKARKLTPDEKLILAANGVKSSAAILVGIFNPLIGALVAAYDPAESRADIANIDEALAQGASIDYQEESSGYTALIYGAYGAYPGIVQHLVDSGADVEIKESYGYNAYTMAKFYAQKYTRILKDLETRPLAKSETQQDRDSLVRHYKNYVERYTKVMEILQNKTVDKTMPYSFWN